MKKLFKKIKAFVHTFFGKDSEALRLRAKIAVDIVNNLKKVVYSPMADAATKLIPGNLDDRLLQKTREVLPKVASQVALAYDIIQANSTYGQTVDALVAHLKEMHPQRRIEFWKEFAAKLTKALADDKLTFVEAFELSQQIFEEYYQPHQQAA